MPDKMGVVSPIIPAEYSLRRVCILALGFVAIVVVLHLAKVGLENVVAAPLGVGRWFPISYGYPHTPSPVQVVLALGGLASFVGALRILSRVPSRWQHSVAALAGILSILTTTAIQGGERGFVHPIAGHEPHAAPAQYWHDATRQQIETLPDAAMFVQNYAAVQPALGEHGRTHPPGAVLLYALLHGLTGNRPAIAAILICILSVTLTTIGFHMVNAPPFAVLLLCVLPAVQLYYCATLDAVIAGLLWIVIAGFLRGTTKGTLAAIGALTTVSFLTFGFVWVMPVLFLIEVAAKPAFPRRTAFAVAVLLAFYMVLKLGMGFDYLAVLRFASRNENPDGFRLLAYPVEYFATRIENLTDFAFFAGPFALGLFTRGIRAGREQAMPLWIAAVAGTGSLFLLFLSGAYRTGETARACLFLYPPLVALGASMPLSERDQQTLLIATFALSAALQCAGFYFW